MAKNLSDSLETLFSMYRATIGNDDVFDKVVADTCSFLGQCRMDSKQGEWKPSRGFKVVSKDSNTVQLPPNAPAAILYFFALRVQEVCQAGEMIANVSLPKPCIAWVDEKAKWIASDDGKAWLKDLKEKRAKIEADKKAEQEAKAKKQAEMLAKQNS